jgi:hypothetical protein
LAGPCRTGPIEACRRPHPRPNPRQNRLAQYRRGRASLLINQIKSPWKSAVRPDPSPRVMATGNATAGVRIFERGSARIARVEMTLDPAAAGAGGCRWSGLAADRHSVDAAGMEGAAGRRVEGIGIATLERNLWQGPARRRRQHRGEKRLGIGTPVPQGADDFICASIEPIPGYQAALVAQAASMSLQVETYAATKEERANADIGPSQRVA